MTPSERLFRPAWVLRLSNAELSDAFEAALDAHALERRLDVLSDEIGRREREGSWTEKDWKRG
jgi:hypothetical protein